MKYKIKCHICNKSFKSLRPQYKYCEQCRDKAYREKSKLAGDRYREKNSGLYGKNKLQCAICKKWYIQLCSHVYQKYNIIVREYKELIGTYVKKGLVPEWYKEKKSNLVSEDIKKNLIKLGMKTRFKKGDKELGKYTRSPEHLEWLSALGKKTGKINIKKTPNHIKHYASSK